MGLLPQFFCMPKKRWSRRQGICLYVIVTVVMNEKRGRHHHSSHPLILFRFQSLPHLRISHRLVEGWYFLYYQGEVLSYINAFPASLMKSLFGFSFGRHTDSAIHLCFQNFSIRQQSSGAKEQNQFATLLWKLLTLTLVLCRL